MTDSRDTRGLITYLFETFSGISPTSEAKRDASSKKGNVCGSIRETFGKECGFLGFPKVIIQ
jgi:hypothetical protein